MKVAIYARKSNDDSDRNPENKSVARQIEHARAFAAKKVWAVAEEHIYIDDAISGAEYVNRAGFARLIASLPKRGKAPFDVLIMSEASRLGRDMARNTMYLVEIIEAGVQVWYYLTDERERADSPEQKVMLTLRGFASEVERVKAGQRSRDALVRRAQRGFNAGGRRLRLRQCAHLRDRREWRAGQIAYRLRDQ
jgi:DNA invertase Pin-like site-specific DNA recombinase